MVDGATGSARAAAPAPGAPAERRAHALSLAGITHRFGATPAVSDVGLDVAPGEFVALLGPSGCGKTTLLRVIAGFIRPTRGEVLIDGAAVTDMPAGARNVGIVFQSYALFPHMTVEENIAYGLKARRRPREEVRVQVSKMLELVRLGALRHRVPRELSGGQQQRVAVARVLAVEPRILLLDEPFSALDRGLRLDMQIEIKRLQRELGVTTVLVTHDQDEAMSMASRIAVLNRGRLHQFASPLEIYDQPSDPFVSSFVGTTNLLPGVVARAGADGAEIALDGGARVAVKGAALYPEGTRIAVSIRPERFELTVSAAAGRLAGRVVAAMPLGASVIYEIDLGRGAAVKCVSPRTAEIAPYAVDAAVYLNFIAPDSAPVFAESDVLNLKE
ncbi:MAG: ABC transporter ATP-binding protein [Pseudomonadota bacterium]